MEFFDKKEDVIDLELTQFGRHLLSKGQFQPVYYSFFDDNVMYDSNKAGVSENQNFSEDRIKETPIIKPPAAYSSLEKEFNSSYEAYLTEHAEGDFVTLQKTAEKNYLLPRSLGTSDINKEYSPSWTVRFLKGHMSSSIKHLTLEEKSGGKNTLLIPQLETRSKAKMQEMTADQASAAQELLDAPSFANYIIAPGSSKEDFTIILKLIENNAPFQKENFDIEIFEIIDQKEGNKTIQALRPLRFSNSLELNNADDYYSSEVPQEDMNYASHYFDILVDDEIDPNVLCELDPENTKMGVFADRRSIICQDVLNKHKKVPFNIYDTEDVPGEIC